MKNFFKIFILNVFIILIILLLTEVSLMIMDYTTLKTRGFVNKNYTLKNHFSFIKNYLIQCQSKFIYITEKDFRKPAYIDTTKPSIVVCGGSFTHGWILDDNECFHSVLSKYTKRTVYNWGLGGGGPREILYILRNNYLSDKISDNNVQYVIYTYIPDHDKRLYYDLRLPSPHYIEDKNKHLKLTESHKFLYGSFIYRNLSKLKFKIINKLNKKIIFKKQYLYIKEINEEIKNKYPNAKLVIFVYDDSNKHN